MMTPETIDPRELDIVLNEMVLISQRSHMYNRFLETRAKVWGRKIDQKLVMELRRTNAIMLICVPQICSKISLK